VGELGVAVGMARPLPGLAVGLAAVAQLAQQPAHQLLAGPEAAAEERPGDLALAAANPAQRRLRITTDRVLDQRLERRRQSRLQRHRALAPATAAADTRSDRIGPALQFRDRPPDGAARQPGRRRGRGHPAVADRQRFVGRKKPAASFVEELGGLSKPGADVIHLDHTGGLPQPAGASTANPRLCPAGGNHTPFSYSASAP
jgi:hypothetical protein